LHQIHPTIYFFEYTQLKLIKSRKKKHKLTKIDYNNLIITYNDHLKDNKTVKALTVILLF